MYNVICSWCFQKVVMTPSQKLELKLRHYKHDYHQMLHLLLLLVSKSVRRGKAT